ncbi:MAG: endonuclease III [Lachnospiraceae bacterium]|nr:endonuclease III [Lachnospiraceae bacterium]
MKKANVQDILRLLDEHYPDTRCYLDYGTDWQLLFATILSAQCTDERVNIVTKDLFVKYKTLEDFAGADIEELEADVKPTGFYHMKALHIKQDAAELLSRFDGKVPCDIDELTSLPGVGRKTANVIRSHIYNEPSIVVDTHVKRISKLLGLTDTTDPEKAEFELMKLLPKDHWIAWNTQIIRHGRTICKAGRPDCEGCFLKDVCGHGKAR